MKYLKIKTNQTIRQSGFSLMEVIIAIVVFAIGMLALASLQGALTRSTIEAKVRTGAVNIAEEFIEQSRGFEEIIFDPLDPVFAYNSIVDTDVGGITIPGSNGVSYTLNVDVTDYYYDLAGDNFITTAPAGALASDYKTVETTVSWGDSRKFVVEEGLETSAGNEIRSGSILLSANISALSVAATGRIAEESDEPLATPPITYTPGLNPDIVSLALGDFKFKESLTPEPEVFRENLETRFDVVTYSNPSGGAEFLRREEFVAVSCECKLVAENESFTGRAPAIWAGDEYMEPEFVPKAYGVVDDKVTQSPLCDICCRDHHDTSGSSDKAYDPSRPLDEYSGGDHKHYTMDRLIPLEPGVMPEVAVCPGTPDPEDPATASDTCETYVEACKLVRKDGFFRVAQDFRLEGLNTFPEDFLITSTQVSDYSNYVIGEVYDETDVTSYVADAMAVTTDVYQLRADPPVVNSAPRKTTGVGVGSILTLSYTNLPSSIGLPTQKLRSRSIYVDNLSSDLLWVLDCIKDAPTDEAKLECKKGDVELDQTGSVNILEIIPFFELQTTFLNDWKKDNLDGLEFDLTNEVVESGNTHSRGKAINNEPVGGPDMVKTRANRGVSGMSATDKINNRNYELPTRTGEWPPGDIEVITSAGTIDPEGGIVITGNLVSVKGPRLANVVVTPSEAICSYITGTGEFTCFIPDSAIDPKITLTGYDKAPKEVFVCSNSGDLSVAESGTIDDPVADIGLGSALVTPIPSYVITLTTDIANCG